MAIHVQVSYKGIHIPLSEALEKGYVHIIGNAIETQNDTDVSISSRLFDSKNNELFEHDIVQTTDGKYYKIIYDFGVFYLQSEDQTEKIPLYIHKLKNRIDVEKCHSLVF